MNSLQAAPSDTGRLGKNMHASLFGRVLLHLQLWHAAMASKHHLLCLACKGMLTPLLHGCNGGAAMEVQQWRCRLFLLVAAMELGS